MTGRRLIGTVRGMRPVPMPARADLGLAVGLAVIQVSGSAVVAHQHGEPRLTVPAVAVLVAQTAPVALRRVWPITVWAACSIAAVVYGLAEWPDVLIPLGPLLALATVVHLASRRTAAVVWGVTAVGGLAAVAASGDADALDWWLAITSLTVAPLLGAWLRARDELRDASAEDVRRQERRRLARDLHDVAAHELTVLVIQAEAAASTTADPAAITAFGELATSARASLDQLRQVVAVLREDADGLAPLAPTPGLADVPELVEQVAGTGLAVTTSIAPVQGADPAAELTCYRIIQEALTNVLQHSAAREARVAVTAEASQLVVTVDDPGPATTTTSGRARAGRGLAGIVERTALVGGRVDAGSTPAGGWRVRAELPVGGR